MRRGEDRLIYLVAMAHNRLQRRLNNALAAEGTGVTPAQAGILFLLKQKDHRNMTELCRALAVDNATITGLVDRLERDGLVRRVKSATDRRALNVSITAGGVEAADRAKAVVKRVNESIKTGFSDGEIKAYKQVLLKIRDGRCGR